MLTLTREGLDAINKLVNDRAWLRSMIAAIEPGRMLLLKTEAMQVKEDGKTKTIPGTHAYLNSLEEFEANEIKNILVTRERALTKQLADAGISVE